VRRTLRDWAEFNCPRFCVPPAYALPVLYAPCSVYLSVCVPRWTHSLYYILLVLVLYTTCIIYYLYYILLVLYTTCIIYYLYYILLVLYTTCIIYYLVCTLFVLGGSCFTGPLRRILSLSLVWPLAYPPQSVLSLPSQVLGST
jgi:hypothetical protein